MRRILIFLAKYYFFYISKWLRHVLEQLHRRYFTRNPRLVEPKCLATLSVIPYNSSKFLIYFRLLPFNLVCRPYFSFLLKQADASDENGVPSQVTVKSIDQGKRSAEGSPENAPSRKRSVFGDITNNVRHQLISSRFNCTKEKFP